MTPTIASPGGPPTVYGVPEPVGQPSSATLCFMQFTYPLFYNWNRGDYFLQQNISKPKEIQLIATLNEMTTSLIAIKLHELQTQAARISNHIFSRICPHHKMLQSICSTMLFSW
ncbi:hypothetical protein OIU78_018142 [Salix suchowensis]|nr:hypothetical protein OIU78_018142 [Salix suchowensis]